MWDVQLGYTTHNDGPQHWELVFRYVLATLVHATMNGSPCDQQ